MVIQKELQLARKPRGYHNITEEINNQLTNLPATGILQLFIKHTSAALTINESADPAVLFDFENYLNKIVPEDIPGLTHTVEGPDDMPAHIKTSLIGSSVMIPITNHKMNLGVWQGIILCEFRNNPRSRSIVMTVFS